MFVLDKISGKINLDNGTVIADHNNPIWQNYLINEEDLDEDIDEEEEDELFEEFKETAAKKPKGKKHTKSKNKGKGKGNIQAFPNQVDGGKIFENWK